MDHLKVTHGSGTDDNSQKNDEVFVESDGWRYQDSGDRGHEQSSADHVLTAVATRQPPTEKHRRQVPVEVRAEHVTLERT